MKDISILEILSATYNPGKTREIQQALKGLKLKVNDLRDFPNVRLVVEDGQTYCENASLKATGYSEQTGLFALADDSGLEVDSLGSLPGLLSARFAGDSATDRERNEKLLEEIGAAETDRKARFICCLAFVAPPADGAKKGRVLHLAQGICEGTISHTQRGNNGFGFDAIFIPAGYSQTFGELEDRVKAQISHRAKALNQMRDYLSDVFASDRLDLGVLDPLRQPK